MTTQSDESETVAPPDEAAVMEWWSNLGEISRGYWLSRANCGTVADAYAAFKRDQEPRSTESK